MNLSSLHSWFRSFFNVVKPAQEEVRSINSLVSKDELVNLSLVEIMAVKFITADKTGFIVHILYLLYILKFFDCETIKGMFFIKLKVVEFMICFLCLGWCLVD